MTDIQHKKLEFSNPIIKDRIEVLKNSTSLLIFRTFLKPNGGQHELHYHTRLDEKFKVIKGTLNIMIGDRKMVLNAGDEQTIPPFTSHMFYNRSGEQVVFDVEVVNPQKMMNALQIMYGLTNDVKTNKKGLPNNILHTAIGLKMMDAFSPKVPYFIQKVGISTLATLGKIIGLEKQLVEKYCT